MNIEIFQKNILPPNNVTISFPRDNSHIIITWNEVRNPDKNLVKKNITKIMYNIYKGLTQNGIYYKLNNKPLETNRYEDYDITRNPNVILWYKISTVYQSADGDVIEGATSLPAHYEVHNTDRWFYKINERNLWILKNTGMLFDLYTRKYDGERCPRCFDDIRGRAGTQDCPVCYGTGWVGGYDPAFQLYVRLKPTDESLGISNNMLTQTNSPGAWTISNTKLMNRDVLIAPTGTIYQILSANIDQAGGYLFHQELSLRAYDPMDPIYQMKRTTLYPNSQ